MIKSIIKWFNRPYYWNSSNSFKVKFSIGLGCFIYIFLSLFSPLNIKEISISISFLRFYTSVIIVSNLFILFFVVARLFPNFFNNRSWTVAKHFITIIAIITLSSIAIWMLVNHYLIDNNISFFKMLKNSFLIGSIPTLVYIYLDEKYHFKKYKKSSEEINTQKTVNKTTSNKIKNKKVIIFSSNNKESINFKINDLVYITSESNYACFFIKKDNEIKEQILRLPLKTVENSLNNFSHIFRCHKSYIVNTNYVDTISGNARGYYFKINNIKFDIPISRKIKKEALQKIISMN